MTRRRALAVLAGLALAVAGAAVLARFVLHGPVTARTLLDAVEQQSGSEGATYDLGGRCRPREAGGRRSASGASASGTASGSQGSWRCEVWDPAASGPVAYDVTVGPGSSCFRARRARRDRPSDLPADFAGCVHLWQWTVF